MEAVMDVSGWVSGWVPLGFVGEKNDFCCGCVTEQGASEGFERICSQERLWERRQEFWMFWVSKLLLKKEPFWILDEIKTWIIDQQRKRRTIFLRLEKKINKEAWLIHGVMMTPWINCWQNHYVEKHNVGKTLLCQRWLDFKAKTKTNSYSTLTLIRS